MLWLFLKTVSVRELGWSLNTLQGSKKRMRPTPCSANPIRILLVRFRLLLLSRTRQWPTRVRRSPMPLGPPRRSLHTGPSCIRFQGSLLFLRLLELTCRLIFAVVSACQEYERTGWRRVYTRECPRVGWAFGRRGRRLRLWCHQCCYPLPLLLLRHCRRFPRICKSWTFSFDAT